MSSKSTNYAQFIWSIADLLRGSFKPHLYGSFVLPFTVLRRLDSVLADTKEDVLAAQEKHQDSVLLHRHLTKASGHAFYNTSKYTMASALGDADAVRENLLDYVRGFSDNVRDIFEKYKIEDRIQELHEAKVLLLVAQKFAEVDLRPSQVSNADMGSIFEELIRKFAESSNETAGEHFTPREVIRLMVDLVFAPDSDALQKLHITRSVYDPTAGTGGMLSVAEEWIRDRNPDASLALAGQEINPESYAICKADMVIKGQQVDAIVLGDTLTDPGHIGKTYNYCLSNPPFGVEWKKARETVEREYRTQGFNGRFGPGLPRVSDGSLLFLLHLIAKMRPAHEGGGRAAIVLNGSPLFTGGAGSGESEIRRYVLEQDLLDAIIALPTDMFYNTGISTYIWVLDNNKAAERRGKVQLIDGTSFFQKMRKSLGSKRKELGTGDIERITRLYGEFEDADGDYSKLFATTDFGYRTITVERPLQLSYAATLERIEVAMVSKAVDKLENDDAARLRAALASLDSSETWLSREAFRAALEPALAEQDLKLKPATLKALEAAMAEHDDEAEVIKGKGGKPEADPNLRDTENVPLNEDVEEYFAREVKPFVPDAWIDGSKTKIGYEIPFTRHFYKYVPPRSLEEIDKDLDEVLGRIRARLEQVHS